MWLSHSHIFCCTCALGALLFIIAASKLSLQTHTALLWYKLYLCSRKTAGVSPQGHGNWALLSGWFAAPCLDKRSVWRSILCHDSCLKDSGGLPYQHAFGSFSPVTPKAKPASMQLISLNWRFYRTQVEFIKWYVAVRSSCDDHCL